MADPGINNNTDMWLREVRDELRAIREIFSPKITDGEQGSIRSLVAQKVHESEQRPASSTDAETPAQPTSQGKRALPNPPPVPKESAPTRKPQ